VTLGLDAEHIEWMAIHLDAETGVEVHIARHEHIGQTHLRINPTKERYKLVSRQRHLQRRLCCALGLDPMHITRVEILVHYAEIVRMKVHYTALLSLDVIQGVQRALKTARPVRQLAAPGSPAAAEGERSVEPVEEKPRTQLLQGVRLARVCVDMDLLLQALTSGSVISVAGSPMPSDVRVTRVMLDPKQPTKVMCLLTHDSFAVWTPGHEIPFLGDIILHAEAPFTEGTEDADKRQEDSTA
jgi:hypothetical protein